MDEFVKGDNIMHSRVVDVSAHWQTRPEQKPIVLACLDCHKKAN